MNSVSQALLIFNSMSDEERSQFMTLSQRQTSQNPNACENILDQMPDIILQYLKEHQKEAVDFLYKRIIQPPNGFYNKDGGKGAIIAHNMGLGKTTSTVAFLYGILNEPAIKSLNFKILIVSPVNVIEHWIDEFKKDIWDGFFKNEACVCQLDPHRSSNKEDPHDIRRMQLSDWHKGVKNKTILILGYEIYDKMLTEDQNDKTLELLKIYLQNPGPDVVIFDESHRLKNNKTLSYITKMDIKTNRRILLTGTPLENGPMELYHVVEIASPGFLDSKRSYYRNYAKKIERGKVTDDSIDVRKVARETEERLYNVLKEIMHRKDSEFLHNLINVVKKEITITFCETEEQKTLMDATELEYENAGRGDKTFLTYFNRLLYLTSHPVIAEVKDSGYQKLTKRTRALKDPKRSNKIRDRQGTLFLSFFPFFPSLHCLSLNKMKALFDIIEACDKDDEKLVVFTQAIPTLNYIEHQMIDFKKWEKGVDFFRVDGKTESKKRAADFKEFNNESNRKARLFLLSIKAGSVGINLVGANRMVLFDHCFNPVHNTQATYRIYRIGQERDVYIYRFITKNSSDDCVLRRQIAKEAQSKRTIDGKKVAPKFKKSELKIKRGHEEYELITNERVAELESNFDDEFLINIVKKNLNGIIDVSEHDENFEESIELPDDLDLSSEFEDIEEELIL